MENFTRKLKSKKSSRIIKGSIIVLVVIIALKLLGLLLIFIGVNLQTEKIVNHKSSIVNQSVSPSPSPFTLPPLPSQKVLSNDGYHIFQTFNNCGPAALSMALRFYGINVTQAELGQSLRPYQIPGGDNDDKSVTLEELAEKSKEYGLIPYHRPMGNPDLVRQFIANDIPVIARTWTKPSEDIGHYRVLKGYDDAARIFIQDDSLQNKN